MLLYCHWGIKHFAGDLCAVILSLGYKTFCWDLCAAILSLGYETFCWGSLCYYTVIGV